MDLGSEIRDPEKIYSGSEIQGSKRHRIRIRNTGIQDQNDSGIRIRIKEFKYLNPKKALGNMIRDAHPGSGS